MNNIIILICTIVVFIEGGILSFNMNNKLLLFIIILIQATNILL